MRPLAELERDQPITLKHACMVRFDGAISPATLMAEHERGRLVISKVGRAYFVTLDAIDQMVELCRVQNQVRASGSIKSVKHGPSSTVERQSARAAAKASFKALRASSKRTSQQATS